MNRAMLLLLVSALSPSFAAAQNLLANASLDQTLSSWTFVAPLGGTATWNSQDAQSSVTSGCALITNDAACQLISPPSGYACPTPALQQCVAVTPSSNYHVGLSALVPSGQSTTGSVFALFQFFASSDCSGSPLIYGMAGTNAVGAWTATGVNYYSPPGAASALVSFETARDETFLTGSFVAYLDDVFFGLAGTPVSLTTFSAE